MAEAHVHGDPRHWPEDIQRLKTRIRQLEQENKDLTDALIAATTREVDREIWRMRGW